MPADHSPHHSPLSYANHVGVCDPCQSVASIWQGLADNCSSLFCTFLAEIEVLARVLLGPVNQGARRQQVPTGAAVRPFWGLVCSCSSSLSALASEKLN